MAVKAVHYSSMAWDHVCKVLHAIFHTTYMLDSRPTFTLNALLKPEAKKPPKGARSEANTERAREWSTAGYR